MYWSLSVNTQTQNHHRQYLSVSQYNPLPHNHTRQYFSVCLYNQQTHNQSNQLSVSHPGQPINPLPFSPMSVNKSVRRTNIPPHSGCLSVCTTKKTPTTPGNVWMYVSLSVQSTKPLKHNIYQSVRTTHNYHLLRICQTFCITHKKPTNAANVCQFVCTTHKTPYHRHHTCQSACKIQKPPTTLASVYLTTNKSQEPILTPTFPTEFGGTFNAINIGIMQKTYQCVLRIKPTTYVWFP
jgi:hypothetical protein